MSLIASILRLTWLLLQVVDTCKTLKRPDTRRKRVRKLDEDGATQFITPTRPRMSTLKRDQWRTVLKSWIVWLAWSYAEAFADKTIGLVLPFYGQIKIILLVSLSIPRSSTLPYIYDRFFLPWMKKYSRTIDLWTGLLFLLAQFILQLSLCATIVPAYNLLDSLRRRSRRWRWGNLSEAESIEPGQVGGDAGENDKSTTTTNPSSINNDRPTPTTPSKESEPSVIVRRKPRKSVLDNVIEFSLGSPKTLRQAVHQAKALYDAPRPSGLRQEVNVKSAGKIGKGDTETKRSHGIRTELKGKAPGMSPPASRKPLTEATLRQTKRRIEPGVTRSRQPVRGIEVVASQTTGRNPRNTRGSKTSENAVGGIKGSSQDPIVLDDRDDMVVKSSEMRSSTSKTTEAAFLARLGNGLGATGPEGLSVPFLVGDIEEENPEEISRTIGNIGQPAADIGVQPTPDLESVAMHIEPADSKSTEAKVTPRKRKVAVKHVDERTTKTRKLDDRVAPAPGTRLARIKTSAKGSDLVDPGPSRTRERKAAENVSIYPTVTAKPAPKARVRPTRLQNDERPRTRSARRKEETVDPAQSASSVSILSPVSVPESIRLKQLSGGTGVGTKRTARNLGQPQRPDKR